MPKNTCFRSSLNTIAAAALLAASGQATAQNADTELGPYYFKASQRFSHDDNIYRVADDTESDWTSTTSLEAGIRQRLSRQTLVARAIVSRNQFDRNSELNNTGYDLGGTLFWELGSRWSGEVKLGYQRQAASFGDYGTEFSADDREELGKVEESVGNASIRAQYGLVSLWSLEALAATERVRYSNAELNGIDEFEDRERDSDTLGVGVLYRPSGFWTFGLRYRDTDGKYPRYRATRGGPTEVDDFDRRDIDLTARLEATGRSTLDARLSRTKEEHTAAGRRDFSGWTGEVGWQYQLTGKIGLDTRLLRETGAGSTANINNRLTNRLDVGARWDATSKIRVNADFAYAREQFDETFGAGDDATTEDNRQSYQLYGLSANYQATRSLGFSCGVRYQDRDGRTNDAYDYTATTGFCLASFAIQ